MSTRFWVIAGLTVGSMIGSYIPVLFGASLFSMISIFGSFIGGIIGIWAGFVFFKNFFE